MSVHKILPAALSDRNGPRPLSRIELHCHIDGAVRHSTAWELSVSKKLPLPGTGCLSDLKSAIVVTKPTDLQHFLDGFKYFAPAFASDPKAIARMGFEFCGDLAHNGVLYAEARFCPHLMLDTKASAEMTAKHVVEATIEGIKAGERMFGVKVRLILCCIVGMSQFSREILALCEQFRTGGYVVGIDLAGNEASQVDASGDSVEYAAADVQVFEEARRMCIHRTVHAGEDGPPNSVKKALDQLHAERIGHGYSVMRDKNLYKECLQKRVHFEACPASSILTGSVKIQEVLNHPIVQYAKDGANFSISTDDPTVTDTGLQDEYELVQSWGLSELDLTRANFNAARSCFLPEHEKKELVKTMMKIYGVDDDA